LIREEKLGLLESLVLEVLENWFWYNVTYREATHATKAIKMGYSWKIGNGGKVRFWEDCWFGTCSLAIQYWKLYSIINYQGKSVRDAWDGHHLRFTFRRTIDSRTIALW
jgi:hypothetical protein